MEDHAINLGILALGQLNDWSFPA